MADRAGLLPLLFAVLLLPALAWAADEPVATAPIPPPTAATPPPATQEHAVPAKPPAAPAKAPSAATLPAAPSNIAAGPKKPAHTAAVKRPKRKIVVAHRPLRHVKPAPPQFAARVPAPRPSRPRYYEELVPVPEGDGPAMPPWFQDGPSMYGYPGPRGRW